MTVRYAAIVLILLVLVAAVAGTLSRALAPPGSAGTGKPAVIAVRLQVTGAVRANVTLIERRARQFSGCIISRDTAGTDYLSVRYRFDNIIITGPSKGRGFGFTLPRFRRGVSSYPHAPDGDMGIDISGHGYSGFHTPGWTMSVQVRDGGKSGRFTGKGLVDASGKRHLDVRGSWTCAAMHSD
jgi:hypothetical protein